MNQWQAFLQTQDALDQDRSTAQDTLPAARLIPMQEHSLITVEGADAQKFLQGQLTCDLRRLEQAHSLLGAHCNPKGRMISSFQIAGSPHCISLRLHNSIADSATEALHKYIVFSKAKIRRDERLALALLGDLPPQALPFEPPAAGQARTENGLTIINHGGGYLELWLTADHLQVHGQQLLRHCRLDDGEQLKLHWIRCGLAEVQAASQDAFLPQMFNYHLLDAISFKKGCYTGQEIIARMHYRGRGKVALYRGRGEALALGEEFGLGVGGTGDGENVEQAHQADQGRVLVQADELTHHRRDGRS